MATILVIGALDTKGQEFQFLKEQIEARGHRPLVMDVGVLGEPPFSPEVGRHQVVRSAGEELRRLVQAGARGRAVAAMARGAEATARDLHEKGAFDAVISTGGGAGTAVGTTAMRALPLGLPKVMLSTVAGGDVASFVGMRDIVMVPSLVDISGLNRMSRRIIVQAAGVMCGMVEAQASPEEERPLVAASLLDEPPSLLEGVRSRLEKAGYEVLHFEVAASGERSLEPLIEAGFFDGVLDGAFADWVDAGPDPDRRANRLEVLARTGTPAVLVLPCPTRPGPLLSTTPEETERLGKLLAQRLNACRNRVAIYLSLQEIPPGSGPGDSHRPEAGATFFRALRRHLREEIPVHGIDAPGGDPFFARALADGLLALMGSQGGG